MRALALVVLLSLAVAGCTLPGEDPHDPLFGVCPQWEPSKWTEEVDLALETGRTSMRFAPVDGEVEIVNWTGFPLDLYRIRIEHLDVVGGTVELRAFGDTIGRQRGILDYRDPGAPSALPVLMFADGANVTDTEFDIYLSPVAHDAQPAPDALRLQWDVADGATVTGRMVVEAGFKVCGAPLPS